MSKIITIIGNPASGKSLLACQLAAKLSKTDEVLLVNYSADVPMHPIWQPGVKVEHKKSFGLVLSSPSVSISAMGSAVELLKDNPNLGLIGYTRGDTPLSNVDVSYQKSKEFLKAAAELTDGFIIVDCSSDFSDPFRPAAIELADKCFMTITPDLRGLHYYNSQKALLSGKASYRFNKILMLAGNVKPYHPIAEINEELEQGFWGVLDYAEDLEKCMLQGEMFHALRFCPNEYAKTLAKMRAVIANE